MCTSAASTDLAEYDPLQGRNSIWLVLQVPEAPHKLGPEDFSAGRC